MRGEKGVDVENYTFESFVIFKRRQVL